MKIDVGSLKPQELLDVELKDESILKATDIVLGLGVTKLLALMGMTIESPELKNFLESVKRFYKKSTERLIKYFMTVGFFLKIDTG